MLIMHTLDQVKAAIVDSWDEETAYDGIISPTNRARNQCVPTALVVQSFFGGDLQKLVTEFNRQPESHYRNILPDGTTVDLTRDQYPINQRLIISEVNLHGYDTVRDKMLAEKDTKRRYEILLKRVNAILHNVS